MSAIIGTDVPEAARILQNGGLVAIPTETVYGLAANALDPMAVRRIFEAKQRPAFDPLIVHFPELQRAKQFVTEFPDWAQKLAERFWPGPLTLVLPRKSIIPDIVTSGLDTVGIRVPDHPLSRKLLESVPFPLAAPSANRFGHVSPVRPEHVVAQLGNEVQYVLDGGRCRVGLESTIVGYENGKPVIYRKGGIAVEEISKVIGEITVADHSTSDPRAPGMLKSHYAPARTLVRMPFAEAKKKYEGKKVGFLGFDKAEPECRPEWQLLLSPNGNLGEAAFQLFECLRRLEDMEPEVFAVAAVPDHGLGKAINDRLKRAAAEG